jgi:hypothetical protein
MINEQSVTVGYFGQPIRTGASVGIVDDAQSDPLAGARRWTFPAARGAVCPPKEGDA